MIHYACVHSIESEASLSSLVPALILDSYKFISLIKPQICYREHYVYILSIESEASLSSLVSALILRNSEINKSNYTSNML